MAIVLKYAASVYQAKLNKFDSLNEQLQGYLNQLKDYKGQIPNFWDSTQAKAYTEEISDQIIKVTQAHADIASLSRTYREIMNEQTRVGEAVDEVIQGVTSAVSAATDLKSAGATYSID